MSWTKRAQSGAAPPGPERPPYAASQTQSFGNQENMYPNYQGGNIQPQQQYWQMPPQQPQYNQQYGQVYQQQDYPTNANQFHPQQTYNNMNYASQVFSNTQQARYPQQNYYPNQNYEGQGQPQNFTQSKPNADSWEDNWDWGWGEDSSKQVQKAPQSQNTLQQQPAHQQQPYNNANIIEQSFNTNDSNSWNWAMDDKKESKEPVASLTSHELTTLPVSNPVVENATILEASTPRTNSNMPAQNTEEVQTLSDREVVKERMPNLALGKRFQLDTLTPQWSIESQMSQESSDGPHTQSEGTYRSENHSRNSNNSPSLNTDNSNFNYSQGGLDEGFIQNSECSRPAEFSLTDSNQINSRRESHDELASSLNEMSLANQESFSMDSLNNAPDNTCRNTQEAMQVSQPPPAVSPASFPPPVSTNPPLLPTPAMPPAPPVSSVPLSVASSSSITLSAPPSSSSIPPSNLPLPISNLNPFKHLGTFSHKSLAKGSASSMQAFPSPQISTANLTSPAVVNKVSQHRVPVGFEANLETTPDNSERPDQPQVSAFRSVPVSQQVPDNMEVAPRNDRNEYLQTAHLSSSDFGENTDFSRGVPPPGLRRMVVGQQESEYTQNLNISGDEPPPGLSRMVPGQQTEINNSYNQPGDNYLDRHIDGQTTDNDARPYRQADGQPTIDNYNQQPPSRVTERRPVGLDRMVPGEPSNDEYSQYQGSNYAVANEQRVVTGVDHDFAVAVDAGPSDVREQNVDGSDYTEQNLRNPTRNVIGARESGNDVSPDFTAPPDDHQREVTMEGENLQDLSVISSTELRYSREQVFDGADVISDVAIDRKTELSDSIENHASNSRRQSLNRLNTSGEDSERDRTYKTTPRKDKHKSSRERDRDREHDRDRERDRDRDKDGRYSRGDRKHDPDRRSTRDERRSERDRRDRDGYRDRKSREESPDARRHRRSTRPHRYETEDTDYYSDRERDRRRHREGSYTSSKPPRPEDKERRYEDRERSKRYNTIERERRYGDESRRRGDRYRDRDDYERAYRDIDPTRKYGNLRRQRERGADDPRRADEFSSPSRPDSRDATVTDDDGTEPRRRDRRSRRTAEPFYDEYGGAYAEAYRAQQQQYRYYEQLRRTDPAAYAALYRHVLGGPYADDFGSISYDTRQERGSVHSGRSSTTGLKGNETELTTDMSLNLHLEESTVRSERMTPFRYSTAHIKGSVSSRDVVVVRPSYPVDGAPATVLVVSLAEAMAQLPASAELAAFPGPLVKGVTHKKSVIDYCNARALEAAREGPRDVAGYALLWDLLALMLRQNGVVVGSDIAELLMKNTREYEYKPPINKTHNDSRRGSALSSEGTPSPAPRPADGESPSPPTQSTEQALDRLRELLTYGNRQEAIEWAVSNAQWGHAWALAAHADRRTRAALAARFLAALPRADPLHTLYATLAATTPPAAACVADERWADWRPHAAMILANCSTKPDHDKRTLMQLGDSLSSRGLLYSAQFCYLTGGAGFCRHPLAPLPPAAPSGTSPPRLALLLADPRADSLQQFATNKALFATEVYEYALSLSQDDFVITELQTYKLVLAARLADCGRYERALAYAEVAARALTRAPALYSRALVAHVAALADRLQYHDPALQVAAEEPDSADASPRHQQWLHDVKGVAAMHVADASSQLSAHSTPQHNSTQHSAAQFSPTQHSSAQLSSAQHSSAQPPLAAWDTQQAQQYQQIQQPVPMYGEIPEDKPDCPPQYYAPPQLPSPSQGTEQQQYAQYDDWPRPEEHHQQYADPYWQTDQSYYGEVAGTGAEAGAEEVRPSITMPGTNKPRSPAYDYADDRPPSADNDRDTDTPKTAARKQDSKSKDDGKGDSKGNKGGWLGGILNKLSLRPPNQMILPDDKNPSIVWDPETKRWKNVDSDGDEPDQPPPPPPKTQDLTHIMQSGVYDRSSSPQSAPSAAPVSNIFKMQKGRHIKKSYVDVFNPSGAPTRALPPAADVLGPPAPLAAPPTYFVPAPLPQGGGYEQTLGADYDKDMYHSGI